MRPAFQLQTVIKAMTDVVLPAVDPANKLAQEQAQLVVGMLSLLLQRLPLQYRYDRDELQRYLQLARELSAVRGGAQTQAALADLSAGAAAGAGVLQRAAADPAELEAAVLELRAKVGELIGAANADGEPASLPGLQRSVLAAAKVQTARERAWLAPTGFEADPKSITPIERQLSSD
ncbi:MAG: hypothetical protein ISP90_03285 [Nevskia sp.]|nr:hypothetical protein [Nevskia sp.]